MAGESMIKIGLSLLIAGLLLRAFNRLVLSPLAVVPGPKLAALTTLYAAYYDVVHPAQYVFKIKELHKKYGPIVRVSPWEVHVNDVDFLDSIYNPPSRKRNKFLPNLKGLPLDNSCGGAPDWQLHRMRREALNPFFSHKKVLETEDLIREKIDEVCSVVDGYLRSGEVLNFSDLSFALALDVVRKYSFGQDQDVLSDLNEANRLRNNILSLLRGTKFSLYFGWVLGLVARLPKQYTEAMVPPGVKDLADFKRDIRKTLEEVFNDKENKLKGERDSVFYDLKDNPDLPDHEKSIDRVEDEGSLLIMAGTESTAKSMQIAYYYLLANPPVLAKLRDELNKAGNPTSLKELEQLPYLSAVICEANRLSFGLTGRNTRVAPSPEVLQYKQYVLPPGTAISMSTLCVHTNENIFPDPWTFNPERFMGKEGLERRKYMMSLGRGTFKCLGINLAHAEMCMVLAAIARYDMELFETEESDVKFVYDYHVAQPRLDSKGVRARVVGKA